MQSDCNCNLMLSVLQTQHKKQKHQRELVDSFHHHGKLKLMFNYKSSTKKQFTFTEL